MWKKIKILFVMRQLKRTHSKATHNTHTPPTRGEQRKNARRQEGDPAKHTATQERHTQRQQNKQTKSKHANTNPTQPNNKHCRATQQGKATQNTNTHNTRGGPQHKKLELKRG